MRKRLALLWMALFSLSWFARGDEVSAAQRRVSEIRGLEFEGPVARGTIDRSELRGHLRAQLVAGSRLTIEEYVRLLQALKLIDRSPQPIERLLDLYEAQVLAFYDPATHTYVSLRQPPEDFPLSAVLEKSIVVHEMVHALQDQRFDAGRRIERIKLDWDASLAYLALLEGEATLVMFADLSVGMGMSLDELVKNDTLVESLAAAAALNAGVSAEVPRYFVETLKFPYVSGTRFVVEQYRRGGWNALNAIHARPPGTTAEILRPEGRGPGGSPRLRFRNVGRVRGSSLVARMPLGEFHWRFLLGQAARGLVKDIVHVFETRDGGHTVFSETLWESNEAASRFHQAYLGLLRAAGEEPLSRMVESRVRIAYGRDRAAADRFCRR